MAKKQTFYVDITGICSERIEVEATSMKSAISHVKEHGFGGADVIKFGTTNWDEITEVEAGGKKK